MPKRQVFFQQWETLSYGRFLRQPAVVMLLLAIAGAYILAAKLGLSMAFMAEQVTVVWPPTGIALAAIILLGQRVWPAILIGAFFSNLAVNEPPWVAFSIAIGNTLEALAGAWLLHRFINFRSDLSRISDVLGLVACSAFLSTSISATIGVTSLCAGGIQDWSSYASLWTLWWIGDAAGALIVAPVVMVWATRPLRFQSPLFFLESMCLLTGLVVACLAIFTEPHILGINGKAFIYVIFPFLIWASLRFGQHGTTVVTTIASGIAIWATLLDMGPFSAFTVNQSLTLLQVFMAVVTVTGLLLSAAVNERKNVEESLRHSNARIQMVVDHALDAIISIDRRGNVREWNHQAENMFGWSRDEATGRQLVELIIPQEQQPVMMENIQRFLRNGYLRMANTRTEVETVSRHGKKFNVELTLTVQKINDDYYFTAFIRDISDRQQMQNIKNLLAAIVESSDDAIISKDLNGIISSWNVSAENLFGYHAVEAIGKPITMLIPTERLEEERRIIATLRRGERVDHFETERVTKDGKIIHVSLTVSPIYDSKGNIIGASKVARDITGQKDTERALKTADRRKNEFIAMLAHELRNPLGSLHNALYLLQAPNAKAQMRKEAMEIMERQLRHLVRLVDDMLDISRITHGKLELRKERILLSDAVKNALETNMPVIEAKKHELTVNIPETQIWLDADAARISQILSNLLNNAAKYTPEGGHIWLEAELQATGVVLKVRDTGIGIPAEILPKIFNLFTQADSLLSRTQDGLGIGLTLVKNLVEMHGGKVSASSRGEGQGSEFQIHLPLALPPQEESEQPQQSVATQSPSVDRLKVLITDDSRELAKTLGWMVEGAGHEIRIAHEGKTAIEIAQSFLPDVIFLDIGLPGMDGFEVCQRLRALPALKHTVLVAQTGWSQRELRDRTKKAGFDYHLVKPVEMEMVEELLQSISNLTSAA